MLSCCSSEIFSSAFNFIMSKGFIARIGKTVVHKAEAPNKERFRKICKTLGLTWIDADAVD